MIQELVDEAIRQLDEQRKQYGSKDPAISMYTRKYDYMEEDVKKAAEDVRKFHPLNSQVYYGEIYNNFLYEVIKGCFTPEGFEQLKFQAGGLCKWFGDKQQWDTEEQFKEEGNEKALWTSLEHLRSLIWAYNCAVRDIDVTRFIQISMQIQHMIEVSDKDD